MSHELTISRLIDAPVDAVWRAWTEHLGEWFCPEPWRAEVGTMDLRPGGASAIVMHGPGGETMPFHGIYLEVSPHARIVSTDAFRDDWRPQEAFMVRIDDFAAEGAGTRYTATARHWTEEACERHRAMGFEAGWGASADQLAAVARRLHGGD